jgi:hypothetical protein
LGKQTEKEETEIGLDETVDSSGVTDGTRQVIAELKRDADARIAALDKFVSDCKTEALTITDPIERKLNTLLLTQVYEKRERVDSEFGIVSTMFIMGDVFLRLIRAKPDSKDARAVARRETKRLMRTLEQRLTEGARKRWFDDKFPEGK